MKQELLGVLNAVRRRMWKAAGLRCGALSIASGLAAACLWLTLGRIAPLPGYRLFAWLLLAGACAAGSGWLLLRRPTIVSAARLLDRSGLEDRMTTALSYADEQSALARLQRADALDRGARFVREELRKALPLKLARRVWMPGVALCAAFVALLVLPNALDRTAQEQKRERAWVEEQRTQAQELAVKLEALPSPHPAARELAEALRKLESELGQEETSAEALDSLEKTLRQMEAGLNELDKQQLRTEQWAAAMQRTEALRALGEALAQADAAGIRRELERLGEQAAKLTPEQKQRLASELERLAAAAPAQHGQDPQAVSGPLQAAATALRGDAAALEPALAALQAGLEAAAQEQPALEAQRQLAAQAAAQLAAGAQSRAQELAAAGTALSGAWTPGGLAERLASGSAVDGAPPGAGAASGTAGSGSGAGVAGGSAGSRSGAGAAGGAAGSGSGAGAAGGSAGSGSGAGGLQGGTGAGSRGLIAAPRERAGAGTEGSQLDSGPLRGGNGELSPTGPLPALEGATRPYEEVYEEYAAEASASLNRAELPQNMQQAVRDYFLHIQPQR